MSWELAVLLGEVQARLTAVEREQAAIRHWALRAVILAFLWALAIAANLSADTAAQLVAGVLKAL